MKKDVIISLAVNGRETYSEFVKGLESSIEENKKEQDGWDGDVVIYKEFPEWCRPHSEIPYAFKFDLIRKHLNDGYQRIYWLDSTMRLASGKNISHLLDKSKHGVVAFDNIGHPLENYINDTAIENLGVSNLKGVKQTWGGCVFWDFGNPTANIVFQNTLNQINKGSFNYDKTNREGFIAHRSDQAVLSWLLCTFGVELLEYGVIAAKRDVTDKTYIIYGE